MNELYNSMMPKPDENLQSTEFILKKMKAIQHDCLTFSIFNYKAPLANLLMNQLMSKANESQRMLVYYNFFYDSILYNFIKIEKKTNLKNKREFSAEILSSIRFIILHCICRY
jgi:hypothetical protein